MNINKKANEISAKYSVGTIPTEAECISYQSTQEGMEWMVEKACLWLSEALLEKFDTDVSNVNMFLIDFKRAMKEE